MGNCVKCGQVETSERPMGFFWDAWTWKERCRYGCGTAVTTCRSCKAVVVKLTKDVERHLCLDCWRGRPKDGNDYFICSGKAELHVDIGPQKKAAVAASPEVSLPIEIGDVFETLGGWEAVVTQIFSSVFFAKVKGEAEYTFTVSGKFCRVDYGVPHCLDLKCWRRPTVSAASEGRSGYAVAEGYAGCELVGNDVLQVLFDYNNNTVKICKQMLRCAEFGEIVLNAKFIEDKHAATVRLSSSARPEFLLRRDGTLQLFVRGSGRDYDEAVIAVPAEYMNSLAAAVKAYANGDRPVEHEA